MEYNYDVVVVGAGPGGYVAAIRAAQLGLKTAVVENRDVGGTCLNRGCIPTKSIMHAADLYHEATHNFETLGLGAESLSFDTVKIQKRKNDVVEKLRNGIEQLFKSGDIAHYRATGTILDPNTIELTCVLDNSTSKITTANILVATGSVPSNPPVEGMNLPNVITSDELLDMDTMYEHLIVAGAGVIGMEFASIYNCFSKEVTIMASRDRVLPKVDKEIAQNLSMILKKRGVKITIKARLKRITQEADGKLRCYYFDNDVEKSIVGDGVLLAAGRSANTKNLFGQGFSINIDEKGCIVVDENFRTSISNIYAIGDVIPGMQLAHVASAQGINVVEAIAGHKPSIDLNVIPDCIYTNPEIACIGLTEEEAKEKGINIKIGKASMLANGKSMLSLQDRGFIKVVYNIDEDRVIGAQLMCARATDMINEFGTAIVNRLNSKQLASVIRPHPTFGEAVTEAIDDLNNIAIHVARRKK